MYFNMNFRIKALLLTAIFYNLCYTHAQTTFKESTNAYKFHRISSHFNGAFFSLGGYENFRVDTSGGYSTRIKLPDEFNKIKGQVLFYYQLDTLAQIKKIWIASLKLMDINANAVIDYITFYDSKNTGFELGYLKSVSFDDRQKKLSIFLLENEWKSRKFKRHNDKLSFDISKGNSYIHLLQVKFNE